MKFLIITEPDDTHALLTKMALDTLGHETQLLFLADHPTRQTNSVYVDNHNFQWISCDQSATKDAHNYDVIWWRRPRKSFLPKDSMHVDDYTFVENENRFFYKSILDNLSQNGWWLNPKESASRCNSKLVQLRLATQCGMKIPQTLCSNEPQKIRDFVLQNQAQGVIYKPLCANFWFEPQQIKISYTSKITHDKLPSNHLLQLTPGIYQREINKQYELRVTCFGNYIVAAKLHSQNHPEGRTDWRAMPSEHLQVQPYCIPPLLQQKIVKFMQLMGIVFGTFDFIVTPENEYIFLEVNEQGQFLWIEDLNPEIPMLDIFINFITQRSFDYQWCETNFQHSILKYRESLPDLIEQNIMHHVDLNRPYFQHRKEMK